MYTDKPVSTQAEFVAAIGAGDYPVITDNGRYEIPAEIPRGHTIKVTGTAKPTLVASGTSSPRVVASGTSSPSVEAYDTSSPSVVAYGTSSPSVVASGTSSPSVEAYDTSSPSVVASGTSSPSVEAYGTSSPSVEAYDTSSPSVVAYDTSSPSVVAYGTSSPSVEAYGTSSPSVVAYGTSSPSVEAYGTSSPSVEAYGTSSPSVEAYGTSSPSVEAYGTSSPSVVAYGTSSPSVEAKDYSSVVARGAVTITADNTATVRAVGDQPIVTGGALVQRVPLTTEPGTVRGMLARIEANPHEWDQSNWAVQTSCGTKYCAAGHALIEVGARIDVSDQTVEVASLPEKVRSRFLREHVAISAGARAVLGIDEPTAERLFAGSNSIERLRELVDEICAGTALATPQATAAAE